MLGLKTKFLKSPKNRDISFDVGKMVSTFEDIKPKIDSGGRNLQKKILSVRKKVIKFIIGDEVLKN